MWHYLLFKDTCGQVTLNKESSRDGPIQTVISFNVVEQNKDSLIFLLKNHLY